MDKLSFLAKQNIPFAFVLNYAKDELIVEKLDDLKYISYEINPQARLSAHPLEKSPLAYETYKKAFDLVQDNIKKGNTYLLNLTFPTTIQTSMNLKQMYTQASAKYKVMLKDRFVSFSPETFVQIKNDTISTYPMKGTISALAVDAKNKILSDAKEFAEHTMIVDLLRNDLGIIGQKVKVEKFRYVENIGSLLQVSSQISAQVKNWQGRLGTIIDSITPAGSITGTPKKKTCELIKQIEGYNRGFFTGIFGVYDGTTFDSCVLIRYIEKTKEGFIFKSGGGITLDSDVQKEYEEMLAKVYLPSLH